jgi:lipopolysaccharide export LptBFGC system permease protein LptF
MLTWLRRIEDSALAQVGRIERILLRLPDTVVMRPSQANRWIFRIFSVVLLLIVALGFLPKPTRVKGLVVLLCVLILACIVLLVIESLSMRRPR